MHCARSVLLGLALANLSWAQEPSHENYQPNPGFEEGMKDWYPWKKQDADITIDDTVSHSGQKSLRLAYKELDRRKETYLFAYGMLSDCFIPGRTYTASGWVKIGNVPPGQKGPCACLSEASSQGESQKVQGPTDPAQNGGWVFVSFNFKPTEKQRGLVLRCVCDVPADCVPGTVWFDDLKVEEGEKPTAFRPDWIPATDFYTRGQFIYFPMTSDYRCSMEVVTPHVELARPCAGGPLRLLWAGHWFSGRQACELAQRGDFQLESVVFNGSNAAPAYFQRIHEECIAVFRRRLGVEPDADREKAPQVLVIEQGSLESFAKPERDALLDRIKKGMGCVVLLGPSFSGKLPGEPYITRKVRELTDGSAKMTEAGRGSVVTVLNPAADDTNWRSTLGIESSHGEVLRAIYRSIGRPLAEVKMSVAPATPRTGGAVKVTVASTGSAVRIRLFPNLPVPDGGAYGQGRGMGVPRQALVDLRANLADGVAKVWLPALSAGDYFLVGQALDAEKRVQGWTLTKLTVESPLSLAQLDAGAATFAGAGQSLSVAFTVKNMASPMEATQVALVYDPLGRLLAQSPPVPIALRWGETRHRVSLALTHAELCSAQVLIQVRYKDRVLASAAVWTSTEPLMTRIDFNAGPYDDFYLGARNYGADIAVDRKPELGLRPFDWIDIFASGANRDVATKSVCDPQVFEEARQSILTRSIKGQAPWHAVACMLHDELDNFGFRSSKSDAHDIAFFRRYLKETYPSMAALNASWGTHYSDWGEIDSKPAAQFLPTANMNPAAWADWNRASEVAAHEFYAGLDVAARLADPGFRIGVSGTRNTSGTNGIDWWLLTRALRSVALYDGISGEIFRSFALPDAMVTRWSHLGASPSDFVHWRIWTDICRHREGTPTYGGRVTNLFYPDYRRNPAGAAFFDELAEIRNGFGRLILGMPLDDRGVAIFYSPACYRAQIVNAKNFAAGEALNTSFDSLFGALSDAGIKPHFVSYEQVARGEVKPETTKVLCLWGALALNEPEAAAIRRYANGGGLVLADTEPGLYDEHCHRLPQARLKNIFEETGAVHPVGKGKAVLFGTPDNARKLAGYGVGGEAAETVRAADGGGFFARLTAVLDKEAGVKAAFTLTDDRNRNTFKNMEGYTYVDGAARYVALVPEGKYGETQKARLTIKGVGQFYDCRAGRYLGAAATQEVELRMATANLFALLPYKVEKVEVRAPATAVLGQPIPIKAVLQTGGGAAVRHVLVAQLRRPDGKDLAVHRWIFETWSRNIGADLFLALNDPAGRWTLVVRDVATGVRYEQPIEIQ